MGWQVQEDIRRRIEFKLMNLVGPWLTFPTIDVVFLRNGMNFFDVATKKTNFSSHSHYFRSERVFGLRRVGHDDES